MYLQAALHGHRVHAILRQVRVFQHLAFKLGMRELVAFQVVFVKMLLHQLFLKLEGIDGHFEINGPGSGIDGGNALRGLASCLPAARWNRSGTSRCGMIVCSAQNRTGSYREGNI